MTGCGCGCGNTGAQRGNGGGNGGGCGCGCSTHKPKSTTEEISQLKSQREEIDRRLDELAAT